MRWSKARTAFAASSVILAVGGLVLLRSSTSSGGIPLSIGQELTSALGTNGASFRGRGAHGTINLTHTKVMGGERVFAELTITADKNENAVARAPASIAVVLDVSGSMSGEKLEQAKRSVAQLVEQMHSDDEIAMVIYSDSAEVLQHTARVGEVRSSLLERVRGLRVRGGTNIPSGLREGLAEVERATPGRVRRIVLVSDGLDDSRAQADQLATRAFGEGITISSLGIGLDFNEAYMGGVASTGHGNFAFVNDSSSLAGFLRKELDEASSTTVEAATFRFALPDGVSYVRALGAEASVNDRTLEVRVGSLFAGDERRVVVELKTDIGGTARIDGTVAWNLVGGGNEKAPFSGLSLLATSDRQEMERGKDPGVVAKVTSVVVSDRQLRATEAYAKGDVTVAQGLIQQNLDELKAAADKAPPAAAKPLASQSAQYQATKEEFRTAKPSEAAGKVAAKKAFSQDLQNVGRKAF